MLISLLTSGIFVVGISTETQVINIAKYIKLNKLDVINMLLKSIFTGYVQSSC